VLRTHNPTHAHTHTLSLSLTHTRTRTHTRTHAHTHAQGKANIPEKDRRVAEQAVDQMIRANIKRRAQEDKEKRAQEEKEETEGNREAFKKLRKSKGGDDRSSDFYLVEAEKILKDMIAFQK